MLEHHPEEVSDPPQTALFHSTAFEISQYYQSITKYYHSITTVLLSSNVDTLYKVGLL